MKEYIYKNGKKLKYGYTTGTCATGATKAAAWMLIKQEPLKKITVDTPKGWVIELEVEAITLKEDYVICAIKKDAGDDPDITNGLLIYAKVKKSDFENIYGTEGIGQVTRPGLTVEVGKSAINPVPMAMIKSVLSEIKETFIYKGEFDVELFVPGGLEISKKTFNPRLGIVGGISIIGTTGIVEPMSDEAFKDSLLLELNQNKEKMLVYAPGNYGRDFCLENGVAQTSIFKISNFVGFMFERAVEKEIKKILFVGHIGKLIKVAGGIFQTHSRVSDGKFEILAAHLIRRNASIDMLNQILDCNTTDEAVALIYDHQLQAVFDDVALSVKKRLEMFVFDQLQVEVIVFAIKQGKIGQTPKSDQWLEAFNE